MYIIDMMTIVIPLIALIFAPLIYWAAKSAFPEVETPVKQEEKVPNQIKVNLLPYTMSEVTAALEAATISGVAGVNKVLRNTPMSQASVRARSRIAVISQASSTSKRQYGVMPYRTSSVEKYTVVQIHGLKSLSKDKDYSKKSPSFDEKVKYGSS